ncbi:hypothetical protein KC331_g12918 [Hortaea werneckii]|nr:hypothetical protein KC331_g12918 [Hortaea werneckii]KAI7706348.1 hypothetical protein KC353_g12310 [Hortaea werneckii]
MASSTTKKRSAPGSDGSAVTTAIKRRRRTDFGTSSMITRSQTLSAARNAVLHTTELLENILYFLPMKDLLFAQRVCMKWRELIRKSIPLQEALFFRPKELNVFWRLIKEPDMPAKLKKASRKEYLEDWSGEILDSAIPNPLLCNIGGLQGISTTVGETIAGQSDTRGGSQKKADDASSSIGEMANPNKGAATTEGTDISASDQIQNMGSGSADHLGLGYRK